MDDKPHLVVSVMCIFPDGQERQVMGLDFSNGNLAISDVLLPQIYSALTRSLSIIEELSNPELIKEALYYGENEQSKGGGTNQATD